MTNKPAPNTAFDWAIYADATCAGLAVLIPIPIVDWLFEDFFRRRMPNAIAKRHGVKLADTVRDEFNRGDDTKTFLSSCLLLPLKGAYWLLKSVSKKILYFLTIKEAADQISLYWHQAFLIDHMIRAGQLEDREAAIIARRAMWALLEAKHTSPLRQLAQQVVAESNHVWRTLRDMRRGKEDEEIEERKVQIRRRWDEFKDYFETLAAAYADSYTVQLALAQQASELPPDPQQTT